MLLTTDVKIVEDEQCRFTLGEFGRAITKNVLCAIGLNKDSGQVGEI